MKFRYATGGLLAALLIAQLFGPSLPASSTGKQITIESKARKVLERSCLDCHSSGTEWPWYARVAPVRWPIANHVIEGRKSLNFSEGDLSSSQMDNILDDIDHGSMPPPSYLWIHWGARLSDGDKQVLREWATSRGK